MDFSVGNSDSPLHLLIIDGAHARAQRMTTLLRNSGYTLKAARLDRAREALTALQQHRWDLVLIETDFASKNTLIAFAKLARHKYDAPLLSYSDSAKDTTAVHLTLENGARDFLYLDEPQRIEQILQRELDDLCTRRTLRHYEQLYIEQLQKKSSTGEPDTIHVADTASDKKTEPETTHHIIEHTTNNETKTDMDKDSSRDTKTAPPATEDNQKHTSLLTDQHDPLTGLYSPSYFLGALKQALSNKQENSSGLLHIEIDQIDRLDKQTSPEIVQLLLSETAGLLCKFQSSDCLAAYCDDASFTILLRDKTKDEIITAAKKLRKLIHEHNFTHLDPELKPVSCSIGLCIDKQYTAADAERLVSQAHDACNKASQSGGNKIFAYDKKTPPAPRHAPDSWPGKIDKALKDNRFNLVFQPIITFNSTANEYYELFLRMLDDDNNEILPAKFILAAEENRMMTAIDQWVVKNSINKLVENHANKGHTNFFIKVSADSIRDPEFLPWLMDNLRNTRGITSHLTFEISEADLIRYPQETRTFVHLLQEINCHTALEHFGTLPESLALLNELDIEYIKLDHSLIHDLSKNPNNAEKIKHIITEARRKGIKVIAVAVQDAQTLSTLWHYDIDHIQGYFLQKPTHELCFDFAQHTL